jgi:hypothetical protein
MPGRAGLRFALTSPSCGVHGRRPSPPRPPSPKLLGEGGAKGFRPMRIRRGPTEIPLLQDPGSHRIYPNTAILKPPPPAVWGRGQ